MQAQQQEPIIIELDDPTPRWMRVGTVLVAVVAIVVMVAPLFMDVAPREEASRAPAHQAQPPGYAQVCQPSLDIPAFAEPAVSVAMPSWMRICDWFAAPVAQPQGEPSNPAGVPRNSD